MLLATPVILSRVWTVYHNKLEGNYVDLHHFYAPTFKAAQRKLHYNHNTLRDTSHAIHEASDIDLADRLRDMCLHYILHKAVLVE